MLGKGLESLIPKKHHSASSGDVSNDPLGVAKEVKEELKKEEQDSPPKPFQSTPSGKVPSIEGPVFHIEVEKVTLNPYQPRTNFDEESLRELAASIREFGILQPLVVAKMEEETDLGTKVIYQLIAGQRRLMAAKLLGLATVPAIIRGFSRKNEVLEMAVTENIQRTDLNAIETARAYARLSDEFGVTQREIAQRLGKSRGVIANTLRLLELPSQIQEALSQGKINESQARLLLQVDDPQKQMEVFEQITSRNLSVREVKHKLKQLVEEKKGSILQVDDLELRNIEKELSDFLGAPVKVEFSRGGGKITIHFYSPEEAMGIVQKIKPEE